MSGILQVGTIISEPAEETILVDGALTVTSAFMMINPQDTTVDDLTSIVVGITGLGASGFLCLIQPTVGNTITLINSATLVLPGGNNVALTDDQVGLLFITSSVSYLLGSSSDFSGILGIASGGTGASDAPTARTNLGVEIGVDVQTQSATLDSLSAKAVPTGDLVGTSDTQALTNKDLGVGTVLSDDLEHTGTNIGFYATTPIAKPEVTGITGSNTALESLLTTLSSLGLITNSTTSS